MFYQQSVLDNGITVITEHMDAVHSCSLGFWVRIGSRDETPALSGISHYMEHMLFKGTPTRTALDISSAFDAIGAELNAFTSRDCTCFYARMIDEHLPQSFEILSDMVVNSCFPEDEAALEREVVLEEIARSQDDPEDQVFDVFSETLYPKLALGRPVLGRAETVSGFESSDLRAYHDAHYTSGNLVVVACGNVDHEQVVELADTWLSDMPSGARLKRPAKRQRAHKALNAVKKDTEQAHLILGMPSVSLSDEPVRKAAMSLLGIALGGGMSSRLFQEVREKRGLAYAVYTTAQAYEDNGTFALYAGTRPENIGKVLEVCREQIDDVAQHGISKEELHRACELSCGNFVLGMESPRSHMLYLGGRAVLGTEMPSIEETLERFRSVTVDDVSREANAILTQEPCLAVISPYGKEEIERMLAS
ncbi:MAG: M16 family metallopeptidase [Coriobacteriales bacterium]|jgi:predicted Zn-dependent peptidase